MKVRVWADMLNGRNHSTLVWSGNLDHIPRQGDIIFMIEGWGGAVVTRVYWQLDGEQSVELHIDDHNGEYKKYKESK